MGYPVLDLDLFLLNNLAVFNGTLRNVDHVSYFPVYCKKSADKLLPRIFLLLCKLRGQSLIDLSGNSVYYLAWSPWQALSSKLLGQWNFRMASLEAPGIPVVATTILGSIPKPSRSSSWSLAGCGCHKDPISDWIFYPFLKNGIFKFRSLHFFRCNFKNWFILQTTMDNTFCLIYTLLFLWPKLAE